MRAGLGNKLKLGTVLGGAGEALWLTPEERATHTYVVGASGQGKSKFLEGLIRQDIEAWPRSKSGLLVIDPAGPIFDGVMDWAATRPFHIERPIVPIDFRRKDYSISYNPLRERPDAEASVVVNDFVSAIAHVWGDDSIERTPSFARYAKSLFQAIYERGGSVVDIAFFLDQAEKELRAAMIRDIEHGGSRAVLEQLHGLGPKVFVEELKSTMNRLQPFTHNRRLRATFGGAAPTIDLGKALEEGQIILVCLATEGGNIDRTDGKLFATTFLADLWFSAGQRGKRDDVKPFYVYIDEFQDYLTPTIATTLAEARGYGLHFTLAHQFPSQVIKAGEIGDRIFDSIIGNAESIVAFQQRHPADRMLLADRLFGDAFNPFREKGRIEATKVLAYEKIILEGSSTSTSSGSTTSSSGEAVSYDDDGNILGRVENESLSSSEGATSESSSRHEALAPVPGKELSSILYFSPEEQRLLAAAALQTQGKRHAVVRIGNQSPVTIRTTDIKGSGTSSRWAEKYHLKLLSQCPSAVRFVEALALIEARHDALRQQLRDGDDDDDTPARRRLTRA